MLNNLILTSNLKLYAKEIWKFREETLLIDYNNPDLFAGCMSLDISKSPEEWIDICENRMNYDHSFQDSTVPSSTFLAIRKCDHRLVGVIDLRHHINHPVLETWGGHVGYTVRPSERKKGYATEMLHLNLFNAYKLGIQRLLITCCDKNIGSEKVIVANGGIYENSIIVDSRTIKRYWINVSTPAVILP